MASALLQKLIGFIKQPNFTCDICNREVFGGERVCKNCLAALPKIRERCPRCGRKVNEAGFCLECKSVVPVFDCARSAFTHEGEAARLVVRFKRGQKYLSETLAQFLFPLLQEFPEADSLAFVPMTERAQAERGYNQSQLLAEELSKLSGLPLLPPSHKTRETSSQKTLGRQARGENLRGCFRLSERSAAKGRKVLLVDDTMTTGATLNELSRVYRRAGAEKIYAITVTSVQYKLFAQPPLER